MGFEAFERTEIRDFGCKNFRPKWISADRIFGLQKVIYFVLYGFRLTNIIGF